MRAVGVLREHLPMPYFHAGADEPSMFSFADPDRIHDVLGGAGFRGVTVAPVEAPQDWGCDARDAADFILGSGPLRFLLDQATPHIAHRAPESLTAAVRPFTQPDGVRMRGVAWRRPAAAGLRQEACGYHKPPCSRRGYFASNGLSRGIPVTDVAEWMGHSSIQPTFKIRRHLMPASLDQAVRVLGEGL
ncbi:hypothetical protein ACSNOH_06010 [Streptomyces sp. URMC 127]|uniref:hypothetical protein n=1 Tax=Streptomyces sp. URMC 127 TaxID=3423402 RepID=UPI003F1A2B8F